MKNISERLLAQVSLEDGQTDPWPPPPVSKMSLSKTLKLRVNCHSEQPSGSSDSVVSHHCVTVNVTTSALWRQKHSLYRFCFHRLFPGNIWKTSPAQWRISYNFLLERVKLNIPNTALRLKQQQKIKVLPWRLYKCMYLYTASNAYCSVYDLTTSSESLGCMVDVQWVQAAQALYPLWYAEWASIEQSRARLISPQAMAAGSVVGGWWISVPGYIIVGQGSMGVKDNSLPSFLNQMQIKLKAVEQQIPPLTASL